MKQNELSLVSQGPNFQVFAQDQHVGEILFGLHVDHYGIIIQSGNQIYAYSVKPIRVAMCDPQDALDQLLDAFKRNATPYQVIEQGDVSCIQYNKVYMMLCVGGNAQMLLSLHPMPATGAFAFLPKDAEGHDLSYYHYTCPVNIPLMQPDLNLQTLVHSAGWCASRY